MGKTHPQSVRLSRRHVLAGISAGAVLALPGAAAAAPSIHPRLAQLIAAHQRASEAFDVVCATLEDHDDPASTPEWDRAERREAAARRRLLGHVPGSATEVRAIARHFARRIGPVNYCDFAEQRMAELLIRSLSQMEA